MIGTGKPRVRCLLVLYLAQATRDKEGRYEVTKELEDRLREQKTPFVLCLVYFVTISDSNFYWRDIC